MATSFDRLMATAIAISVHKCPTLTIVSVGCARRSKAA